MREPVNQIEDPVHRVIEKFKGDTNNVEKPIQVYLEKLPTNPRQLHEHQGQEVEDIIRHSVTLVNPRLGHLPSSLQEGDEDIPKLCDISPRPCKVKCNKFEQDEDRVDYKVDQSSKEDRGIKGDTSDEHVELSELHVVKVGQSFPVEPPDFFLSLSNCQSVQVIYVAFGLLFVEFKFVLFNKRLIR